MKNTSTIAIRETQGGPTYLSLPIFCDDSEMQLEITDVLYQVTSSFQEIIIVDSVEFGKCLIIDGVLQSAETDHEIYDNELLSRLRSSDRDILVLGGGDGFISETALHKNEKLNITIADLDAEVVHGVRAAFGQKVFDDPRVNLQIGEAIHFLKTTKKKYDGIICDLTDAPIGTNKEKKEFELFFNKIIALSKNTLRENGWMSIQGGATATTNNFIDEAEIIEKILLKNFAHVSKSSVVVPSYGEPCAFLFASDNGD